MAQIGQKSSLLLTKHFCAQKAAQVVFTRTFYSRKSIHPHFLLPQVESRTFLGSKIVLFWCAKIMQRKLLKCLYKSTDVVHLNSMMNDTKERLTNLANMLSIIANREIEITVRGEKEFTFSFDGEDKNAIKLLKRYFKNTWTKWTNDFDLECDMTCCYVSF